ncbi:hypothetical protein BDR03DRAFT_439533 [Suillus americanus]|nr:hypothetical protein BDR03DRAFT_439533 [Suillus americanus]
MTRRTNADEEWTAHAEMVTKNTHRSPRVRYSKDSSFYFSETRALPKFWTEYVHFSGKVYFHHRRFNLVTPNDIREPLILQTSNAGVVYPRLRACVSRARQEVVKSITL